MAGNNIFQAVIALQCVLLIFHLTSGFVLTNCDCKIDTETLSVDCSDLGISNITELVHCATKYTKELILSNNNVQNISKGKFRELLSLENLRLDHNIIEYVESSAFEGLSKLKSLSLDHNKLNHPDSYANDVFKPLHGLHKLNLQRNCDAYSSYCVYPDQALSAVVSLQDLKVDGFSDFGPGFSKLGNLKSLSFSNTDGYCSFPILNETTFAPLRQTPVSYMQLDGCNIEHLEPNVFRGLRNLTTLIITDNSRLCSDSVENATRGLNETSIETLRFNYWCRDTHNYISLSAGMLKGITNTSMKTLDLSWNYINYVDRSCVDNLPKSLKYLSFKENKIDDVKFLERLRYFDNLETLDLSFQNHFDNEPLSWNRRDDFKLEFNTSLEEFGTSVDVYFIVYLPQNIQTIYMNDIKLRYPVPPLKFGKNKLQYLDSSSCMLTAFLGTWYGLKDLQYYDISSNSFTVFSRESLIDMGNLTTLFLQNNQVGASLYSDREGKTFSNQKKLEVLDLSNNAIKDLPFHIFQNQMSLRNLSLADNAMKNVSFSLKSMTKLQYLNLSGNEIEYLSKENMNFLDELASGGVIHVNLLGNILSCMCDNQHFVNWLATTKVNIVDKDKMECLYRNKRLVRLDQIDTVLSQLKYECSSWIVLTSCVVGFVGLLLVFSLLVLLYHKRWQLRYLWYIGRLNIDPYHHPDDQQRQLLDIDAYISYEQHYDVNDDATLHEIVRDEIYPYFENRQYTVRIREEFDGNEKMYHIIPETVRKTRKVIAFLTPFYCKDYWNIFEFNIAAYEGIYTKRNVIIPVLVGDTSEKHLVPEVRSFVKSKIKAKQFLRFPSGVNYKHQINTFNEQLEYFLKH